MKITINSTDKNVTVGDLKPGDVFKYRGAYFMLTDNLVAYNQKAAVRLESYYLDNFTISTPVLRVRAEMTIEE